MKKLKIKTLIEPDNKAEKRVIELMARTSNDGELRFAALEKIKEEFYNFLKFDSIIKTVKPLVVAGAMVVSTNSVCFGYEFDLKPFKCDNDKWGFKNSKTNQKVIECKWDYARSFSEEGLARVSNGGFFLPLSDDSISYRVFPSKGKWGFVDTLGNIIIDIKYDFVWAFDNGLARVNYNSHQWYDKDLNLIIAGGVYGFIDVLGNEIIPPIYSAAAEFSEGFTRVNLGGEFNLKKRTVLGGKWGFFNTKGQPITELKYNDADCFKNGLARVEIKNSENFFSEGKWGFIDTTGRAVIPVIYDYVWSFSDGLARVLTKGIKTLSGNIIPLGPLGYVDIYGKEVIVPQFDHAEDFQDGRALVKKDGRSFYINTKGERIR